MTSTHYLLGWAIYLAGSAGCLLSLCLITRKVTPRLRRSLRLGLTALLFTPWWLTADSLLFSPAFLTSIYDGLSYGFDAAARAGFIVIGSFGTALLLSIILPVKAPPADGAQKKQAATARHQKSERKEPTC